MTDTMSDTMSDTLLTPAEAAAQLGISERTVWRRIKQGKLQVKHTAKGARVLLTDTLPTPTDTLTDSVSHSSTTLPTSTDILTDSVSKVTDTVSDTGSPLTDTPLHLDNEALEMALDLAQQLQRDNTALASRNEQLAGQVGFLQAKLQDAEQKIALLQAPKDEPEPAGERRPWWGRWRR